MFALNSCESSLLLLLLLPKTTTVTNTKTNLRLLHHQHPEHHHVLQLHFPSSLKAHFKSTLPSSPSEEEDSSSSSSSSSSSLTTTTTTTTTVDYFLMESGGLSNVQALQVIRQVPTLVQDGGRKPRSVIAYFESIGFSKTHISKLISRKPQVLASDVEKTLKPKIQMFLDFGFSKSGIAELMTSKPTLLHTGVETHIKPTLDLIKSFLNKTDDDDDDDLLLKIIQSNNTLPFSTSRRKSIEPNIDVLRQHGVPDSEIVHLILSHLTPLMSTTPKVFKSIVERIVSLGFKPETRKFSTAVAAMCRMKKATWDSKIDLFKGLGWSDEQILDSFRRCPTFLTLSRENLKESIGFFRESLNWDASVLSQRPVVLKFSLKKRVIPRYAVFKCLMSKEIIKQDTLFISMLNLADTQFLSRYVFKYQEQLPYLFEVYEKECMLGGCEEEDNGEVTNQQYHGDVDMTV